MNDSREAEQAAREARDAIVDRPSGSKSGAVTQGLMRYLSAEAYDELRRKKAESGEDRTESDPPGSRR